MAFCRWRQSEHAAPTYRAKGANLKQDFIKLPATGLFTGSDQSCQLPAEMENPV